MCEHLNCRLSSGSEKIALEVPAVHARGQRETIQIKIVIVLQHLNDLADISSFQLQIFLIFMLISSLCKSSLLHLSYYNLIHHFSDSF